MAKPFTPLWDRFWPKVEVVPAGCWTWRAGTYSNGYGKIGRGGRDGGHVLAHRAAWELLVGAIPEGMELDHLCRNRLCVNPDHLEPVTHAENCRRGIAGWHEKIKTHCPRGHPYVDFGFAPTGKPTHRLCRLCKQYRERKLVHGG